MNLIICFKKIVVVFFKYKKKNNLIIYLINKLELIHDELKLAHVHTKIKYA